jgi:serine/threonine protein kinase
MVEHKVSGATYALKMMSKGYIVKEKMQGDVEREKDIQFLCDSEFIIKLYDTYNLPDQVGLLLELAPGGELYMTYNMQGLWGDEKCAKFYIAAVILAFEHLHQRKIIFRDLKPENLLLNSTGRCKLTDMGLAKVVAGKTYTTCGTPDYFAPEILASTGHTSAVDWWTLGVLTFELLSGVTPFHDETPLLIYKRIKNGIDLVEMPSVCSGCETMIQGCCHANPPERLPMKKGGTNNLKKHDWYRDSWWGDFDWEAMENLTMDPPFLPDVGHGSEQIIANFNARQEDMPPQIPYDRSADDCPGWDESFATCT